MKLRKPGPLSAADKTWIRNFQKTSGAKIDGIIGRETLWHLRTMLANKPQAIEPTSLLGPALLAAAIGAATGWGAALAYLG